MELQQLSPRLNSGNFNSCYVINIHLFIYFMFSKEESEPLKVDAFLCESLFTSQIHLFGFEWTTCTQFSKVKLINLFSLICAKLSN